MPLNQQIERGDGKRQPGLQVVGHSMHHFLGMTDQRQHGKHRLDQHPVVPSPAWAQFEVGRIAVAGMKPGIGQDQHAVLKYLDQRVKQGIVDVSRCAQPTDDTAPLIDQQAQFVAHDPAVVGEPLPADLSGTAPFPNRVDQFDTVTVDDPQQGGLSQKVQGPPTMGDERPEQPGSLG